VCYSTISIRRPCREVCYSTISIRSIGLGGGPVTLGVVQTRDRFGGPGWGDRSVKAGKYQLTVAYLGTANQAKTSITKKITIK
jgi:hypothetical protein